MAFFIEMPSSGLFQPPVSSSLILNILFHALYVKEKFGAHSDLRWRRIKAKGNGTLMLKHRFRRSYECGERSLLAVLSLTVEVLKLKTFMYIYTNFTNCEEWRLLGCYAVSFLQEPHGITFQKTPFFIVTAVKTSNLTNCLKNTVCSAFCSICGEW
jgi:hypothetical protein